jgi:hypothetical protein
MRLGACLLVILSIGCSPPPIVLVPVSDVSSRQEINAAIHDGHVSRFETPALLDRGVVYRNEALVTKLAPDDLVEVEPRAGQNFGSVSVRATNPELSTFGWFFLVGGSIASVAIPTIAIATTNQDQFFAGLADSAYIGGGLIGLLVSVIVGTACVVIGSKLVVTDSR